MKKAKKIIFALALVCACAWADDDKRDYLAIPFSRARDAWGEFSLYSSGKAMLLSDGAEILVIGNVNRTCCLLGEYDESLPILDVIDAAEWFSDWYQWRFRDDIVWHRGGSCYEYTGTLAALVAKWREWKAGLH